VIAGGRGFTELRSAVRLATIEGSYGSGFCPTYDYKAIGIAAHDKAVQAGAQPSK